MPEAPGDSTARADEKRTRTERIQFLLVAGLDIELQTYVEWLAKQLKDLPIIPKILALVAATLSVVALALSVLAVYLSDPAGTERDTPKLVVIQALRAILLLWEKTLA